MKSLGVTFLAVLLGCGSAAAAPRLANAVAAVVNDEVITWQEMRLPALRALEGRFYPTAAEYARDFDAASANSLQLQIEQQLILQDAKNTGLNLPESIIEDQIKAQIRKGGEDRVSLIKKLQAEGMTYENYRKKTRDDIIAEYMVHRNLRAPVIVSPAKIEQYYTNNLTRYEVGDQVKLRAIVQNAETPKDSATIRKLAQDIARKMDAGASFVEMASVYHQGSGRQAGGDLGWLDRPGMWTGLADIAFSMEVGQRSGIIGRSFGVKGAYWVSLYDKAGKLISARKYAGDKASAEEKKLDGQPAAAQDVPEPLEYYQILVEAKQPAHVRPLAEVQDIIESQLISDERRRLKDKWLGRLRAKSYVRYF